MPAEDDKQKDGAQGFDLEAIDVSKSYGKVTALSSASIRASYGEIHALLGENGAGKSTMCKVISGSVQPNSGRLLIDGEVVSTGSVGNAMKHGIGTVFQELSLLPDLSVAENMFVGVDAPRNMLGLLDRRLARRRTESLFEEMGIEHIDPRSPVGALPLAEQQMVEIVKVFARKPRVLILDEATSTLLRQDVLWLFAKVRELRDEGAAVFLISHRLHEAFELADRITVFRNGEDVRSGPVGDFTEDNLVEAMLGRQLISESKREPAPPSSEVRLEVRNLTVRNRVHDISFTLNKGEILGLAGLQGQGQSALLHALYGWTGWDGEVILEGKPVTLRSPRDAERAGIALVPEDRRTQGLALTMSIRENLTLPTLRKYLVARALISSGRETRAAADIANRLRVKASSLESDVSSLSGGNQQKVLMGKVLSVGANLLLFADVTRGVDVGTKAEIFELVRQLTEDGTSVVFYSSDATELVHMCHRVAVMFDQTIAMMLERDEITERRIVQASVSGRANEQEEAV